jgi:protein-S-isoprenylcysteine O-methyltransferase Ste14
MTTRAVRPDTPAQPAGREVPEAGALVPPVAARTSRSRVARAAALLFPILLLPVMLLVSKDYGATWDEELQQRRGENIVGFYLGHVDHLDVTEDGSQFYGAPFDVLAVGLQHIVAADPYVVRHLLNAGVGWLGIALCGLLAARLFGSGTALLAMVLLAATPRYFGHSMNNPKDVPFAAAATLVLYVLCRLRKGPPFFTYRTALAMALSLGLALNIRPGALLFLVYLCVLLLYRLQQQRLTQVRPLLETAAWVGAITVGSLIVGSVFWPWALERPLYGPVLGLAQLSKFGWTSYMLFNGRDVFALDTPWDYVPRWALLTLPIGVLLGLVLSLRLLRPSDEHHGTAVALWAVVLFPVAYIIGVHATMYDGIRHLLFIFPPIAVLAAAGWLAALRRGSVVVRVLGGAALLVAIARPVLFIVQEHPNQVVYFNELAGGPAGAYGRYEMDYWGNCLLQAVQAVDAMTPDTVRPIVSGRPLHIVRGDAARYPRITVTEREAGEHAFELVLLRGSRAEVLQLAARPDALARITTHDGALLCTVLPGPTYGRQAAIEHRHDAAHGGQ